MRVAQRVEFSLTKERVEKLIVCLGSDGSPTAQDTRGALGLKVAQRLLQHCQPGLSDVHDTDVTRAHARDRKGRPRIFYAAHAQQHRRGGRGRGEVLRTPQTWDSSPVADFMGLWCDRLLLGDDRHPARCALLEPHVPPLLWGESVMRVAQSHRYLASKDVLLVEAVEGLPFGVVRLHTAQPPSEAAGQPGRAHASSSSSHLLQGATSVTEAVKYFQAPHVSSSFLRLGIGSEHGPRSALAIDEALLADRLLLPLCAFTAALWTANPERAAEYVAAATATPTTLAAAQANQRLWGTMQHAMLSTRDTALLRAYFNEEVLDARFSPAQTRYFAESLLQRLREEEVRH